MSLEKEEKILMLNGELDEETIESTTKDPLLGYRLSTLQDPSKLLFETIEYDDHRLSPQWFKLSVFLRISKELYDTVNPPQNPPENN